MLFPPDLIDGLLMESMGLRIMLCGDINGWVVLEVPLSALPAHGVRLLGMCDIARI